MKPAPPVTKILAMVLGARPSIYLFI